jgi:uncharacterized membrane protein
MAGPRPALRMMIVGFLAMAAGMLTSVLAMRSEQPVGEYVAAVLVLGGFASLFAGASILIVTTWREFWRRDR